MCVCGGEGLVRLLSTYTRRLCVGGGRRQFFVNHFISEPCNNQYPGHRENRDES